MYVCMSGALRTRYAGLYDEPSSIRPWFNTFSVATSGLEFAWCTVDRNLVGPEIHIRHVDLHKNNLACAERTARAAKAATWEHCSNRARSGRIDTSNTIKMKIMSTTGLMFPLVTAKVTPLARPRPQVEDQDSRFTALHYRSLVHDMVGLIGARLTRAFRSFRSVRTSEASGVSGATSCGHPDGTRRASDARPRRLNE